MDGHISETAALASADNIEPAVLKGIVREIRAAKGVVDDARSEMSTLYKDAEQTHRVNKMPLKAAIRLLELEPVKRAAWLRDFEHYCNVLEVNAQHELQLVQAAE